jgi:hypothetical protein
LSDGNAKLVGLDADVPFADAGKWSALMICVPVKLPLLPHKQGGRGRWVLKKPVLAAKLSFQRAEPGPSPLGTPNNPAEWFVG